MNTVIPIELTENKIRKITCSVLADMDNSGNYSVDITNDIISIDYVESTLEMQNNSILPKPCSDTASITLKNNDGKYSPNNVKNIESIYSGKFRNNTKIKILAGFIDKNNVPYKRTLFLGVITKFNGKYDPQNGTKMVLSLKDLTKFAQKKKVPNHDLVNGEYYEAIIFNASISDAINYVLDYCCGKNFPRKVQNILAKLPVIEFPIDQSIWSVITSLCESCAGKAFFSDGVFNFISPLADDYVYQEESQYTFTTSSILDFDETVDEDNIINKVKINSSPKTLQPRTVVVGTPTSNNISSVDQYSFSDGKNALQEDGKTIILKSQADDGETWIGSLNVPLVETITYNDLLQTVPEPTVDDVNNLNESSLIKVWDNINNIQLVVESVDYINGAIILKDNVNISNYNIQISYQYYQNRLVRNKYRWFEFTLDKSARNFEYPVIQAIDAEGNLVSYSYLNMKDSVYLSDYQIFDGNTKVKFKLANYHFSSDISTINKLEIYANPLECIYTYTFQSIDESTIHDFENPIEISNNYILDPEFGKRCCDYLLYHSQNNKTIIEATTKGIPQIELIDRVTINELQRSGISFDFIITQIKHTIKPDTGWRTDLTLESLVPPWVYGADRVEYNSQYNKYNEGYLSRYAYTNPEDPTSCSLRETTYVNKSGEVITEVVAEFTHPSYGYYGSTLIQISKDNGNSWIDYGSVIEGNIVIHGLKTGQTYLIKICTVSINGLKSSGVIKEITIIGKDTPPGDVESLQMTQDGDKIKVIVNPPSDTDIKEFELRMGTSWEESLKIIPNFILTNFSFDAPQDGTLTFWIKSIDNSGNYSQNAVKCIVNIYNLPEKNIIYELNNDYSSSLLDLNSEIILPDIDLGNNIIDQDCFYRDLWGNFNLKTKETLGIYPHFSDIFNRPILHYVIKNSVKTIMSILIDYNYYVNNNIEIYYRTKYDSSSEWGSWIYYAEKQFTGRYIQIKLVPQVSNNINNIKISSIKIKIDVPDITEITRNISVPPTGIDITFKQKYYTTPFPTIWAQDLNGKLTTYEITNLTRIGCTVKLLDNSQNYIPGTISLMDIRGY